MRSPLLTLLIALIYFSAYAQVSTLHYDIITEADGLSNHNVSSIVQNEEGYIWIGTSDGLNRFDGYSYKVYRKIPGDSTSLQQNYVTSLAIDHTGKMWIGFSPNGISSFDPLTEKFTNYKFNIHDSTGISESPVNMIFVDSKNNIWVCCVKDGFYRFDPLTGRMKKFGPLPGIDPAYTPSMKRNYNNVNRIYEDKTGLFWLTTSDGLYTFNPATALFHSLRAKPIVPFKWRDDGLGPICDDHHDRFWLGSWGGGLQSYNRKTGEWKMFKYHPENPESGTDNLIHDIKAKSDSELWVGTGTYGLAVFNMKQERYIFFNKNNNSPDPSSSSPNCWQIFSDKWSNKWLTLTDGLGFMRANSDLFQFKAMHVTRTDNGDNFGSTCMYKDTVLKKLFIATSFADGLNVLDEKTNTLSHLEFKIRMDEGNYLIVTGLLNDHAGNLWVLTRDYLYRYDRKTSKLILAEQPPIDTSFRRAPFFESLFEDSNHRLWISTLRYGVFIFDPQKKSFKHFLHEENNPASLCSDNISDITEDAFHRIWLSSAVDGISVYDESCRCFTNLSPVENDSTSLPNKTVTGVCRNSKGDIWVSSIGGISVARFPHGKKISFLTYTVKDGLPSESAWDILCDKKDNVWFTTPAGLARLEVSTGIVNNYTDHEGLERNYPMSTLSIADDGELFIGTPGGYIRFYPDLLVKKQLPPTVVINSVKVFDKNFPFREHLKDHEKLNLTWKDNFFSFEFAALNFSEPQKNQFAYMLSGFDKDWIFCGNRRYASYTNLNGGDYIFKVKASNEDGIWSSNEISIPIHIEPPYWKKTWFLLCSVGFASLLVYSLYIYRIRQISLTEKMKTDFNRKLAQVEMRALRAQMNPHFIFNCLNSINRYIVKSETKTASMYLTKFSRLIRLILDNSESTNVELASEIESLKLYIEMESLRFENKFSYEIRAGKTLLDRSIQIPALIVQPYVENAIWHGLLNKESAGKLTVEVIQLDGGLQFIVEDNGVGRAKAQQLRSKTATERKSLGMKLTEERIAILNGENSEKSSVRILDLHDQDGVGCGTKVIITIPEC
jgi:ligand-binding sensor domain-containing protein